MSARLVEFLILFFAAPAVFAYTRHRIPAIPALWGLTGWCLYVLLQDAGFARQHFWNAAPLLSALPSILIVWGAATAVGVALILHFRRDLFLNFPRHRTRLWALVMVAYPVLSVYPQGIVFRAFLFERYGVVFGTGWPMMAASAAAFCWIHIVFRNRLALILTLLGGVLFALRYQATGSLLVSSVEHAMYGCTIFTIGIGEWFYHRGRRSA